MPDPTFQTISSSQVPDLLNISPWGTRLTLFNQFARRIHEDRKQSVRMKIGKLFENLILEMTADALALEITPNRGADGEPVYVRHPEHPIGCTVDADVFCPTRGPGTVEAKAVDKYEWRRNWTESTVPKIYDAQLQEQMAVRGHGWGIIACLIYNEGTDGRLQLYERRPIPSAQERIIAEARTFFDDLAAGKVPSPFGLPIELAICNEMFPEVDNPEILDATGDIDMAETIRLYKWTADQARGFSRAEAEMKPKVVAYMKDHERAVLAGGVRVRLRKPTMAGQVVMLPADVRKGLRRVAEYLEKSIPLVPEKNPLLEPVIAALEWAHIVKQPGVQNRLAIEDDGDDVPVDDDKSTIIGAG